MKTVDGNVYRIQIQMDASRAKDPSWVAGPISGTYPVNVMSIAKALPITAFVTVRWTGSDGEIEEGSVIDVSIPGSGGSGVGSSEIDIVSVEDLGAPPGASGQWPLPLKTIAAITLLCATAALSHRVNVVRKHGSVIK